MLLHRRHTNLELPEGRSCESCLSNNPPAGVFCEHGNIYSFPFTGNKIPRGSGQLHTHELFPPRQLGCEPSERMQKTSKFQDCLSELAHLIGKMIAAKAAGCVQQDRNKGNLILTSHKFSEAACRLCNQNLHQIPEQCSCPNTNGQYISYSLS